MIVSIRNAKKSMQNCTKSSLIIYACSHKYHPASFNRYGKNSVRELPCAAIFYYFKAKFFLKKIFRKTIKRPRSYFGKPVSSRKPICLMGASILKQNLVILIREIKDRIVVFSRKNGQICIIDILWPQAQFIFAAENSLFH